MLGILCEKPSAARNFAKALGGMSGTFNGEAYIITHLLGHVYGYTTDLSKQVPGGKADLYVKWNINNLPWNVNDFAWKRAPKTGTSDVRKKVKGDLSKVDEIVIATDVDPSGEGFVLAWEAMEELALSNKKFSRMYFTDESEKSIQQAFKARKPVKPLSDPEYLMGDYRTKWDFMSMQFTRIATLMGSGALLRQGRLKSAMVVMVGDQLKAIEEYERTKKKNYTLRFRDDNGIMYTSKEEGVYEKEEDVSMAHVGPSAVKLLEKKRKSTPPRKLLDLAGLSSRLASKHSASTILSTYQKMYEDQIVSYPRTEDKTITPEQFNELLPHVDKIAKLVGVDSGLLTHRTSRKTHVKVGGAHGANRPGLRVPNSLNELSKYGAAAKDIYLMLAKNYLAILAEDYVYDTHYGCIESYPSFKGQTNVAVDLGWRGVFDDKDDEDEATSGLGSRAEPFVYDFYPPRPSAATMKWLMKELEKRNIGTGATRTSTYSEVTRPKSVKNKYPLLKDSKGKITMTEFGSESYRIIQGTNIASLDITKQLEDEMALVAKGKFSESDGFNRLAQYVKEDIETMRKNRDVLVEKGVMTMAEDRERYEGVWNGEKVSFYRDVFGTRLDDDACEALLNGEEVEVQLTSKAGKPYTKLGKLKKMTSKKGNEFVGIDLYFPKHPTGWCQVTFTPDEIKKLKAGERVYREDFVSKKGSNFSAYVSYQEQSDGSFKIVPEFN